MIAPVLIGGLIIAGGIALRTWLRGPLLQQAQYPDEPWMWRKNWRDKHIRLNHRGPTIAVLALIACSLLYFISLLVSFAEGALQRQTYWFPIGVGIALFFGIRLYCVNRKWRHSELRLGTLPGVIGGPFQAAILLREHFPEGTPFRVTLTCEQSTWSTGSEDHNSGIHTKTLWQEDVVVDKQLDSGCPDRIALPVYFAIPYDCEPAMPAPVRKDFRATKITWWLSVRLKNQNDMRSIRFDVPVFKTADSSKKYREDPEVMETFAEVVTPEAALQNLVYRSETLRGDVERLHFSLFRWDFVLFLATLCLLSATGLIAAIWFAHPWPLKLIASIVPAGLFVPGAVFLVEMLLWRSSITIDADKLKIEAGYLGRLTTLELSRSEVSGLETEVEFTTQASDFRRLRLRTKGGELITIVKRIHGRQEADAVLNWMAQRMGITRRQRRT